MMENVNAYAYTNDVSGGGGRIISMTATPTTINRKKIK